MTSPDKNETWLFQDIRDILVSQGIPENSAEEVHQKTILVVYTKMDAFCDREKANKFDSSIKEVLNFLSELFSVKIGYSGINTAKSAISSLVSVISNKDIGSHVLVKRFMTGIFNKKKHLFHVSIVPGI